MVWILKILHGLWETISHIFIIGNTVTVSVGIDPVSGAPVIEGTNAADTIYGADSDEECRGYEGDDELYGDAGNDTLSAGDGIDYMEGGSGADSPIIHSRLVIIDQSWTFADLHH